MWEDKLSLLWGLTPGLGGSVPEAPDVVQI